MNEPIWEGVYADFTEAPQDGPGYDSERWRSAILAKLAATRAAAAQHTTTIPAEVCYQDSMLPVVAALVLAARGRVEVLDFGGALGADYYPVVRSLPVNADISFHIVENNAVCALGRKAFSDDPKVHFHERLPPPSEVTCDIIHLGSSLHYVADWQALLQGFCNYSPSYLLLSDLPAGEIPTYASSQRYYESRMPVWFFNAKEVIQCVTDLGFSLQLKARYLSTILGVAQPCPQDNFEEEYRLGYSSIMLFSNGGEA